MVTIRAASLLTVALVAGLSTGAASALPLAQGGRARATIATRPDATPAERTAAEELAHYLQLVTGARFPVRAGAGADGGAVIRVGWSADELATPEVAAMGPEEWRISSHGGTLTLAGGRPRGTLYAVYHFLEDVVGVHWWNPWEETVPSRPTLTVPEGLALSGQPAIRYRDIYMLYGRDGGRFAARSRLNRQGDEAIGPAYGGGRDYGPPYHVHTFYMYVPPDPYFTRHPKWFSLLGGKRVSSAGQLCLTNPELRAFMLERLRGSIEASRTQALEEGQPAPDVFSISQNDWAGACECENCRALAEAEGSEAGPLLEFVNWLAAAIQTEHPSIYLDTLAYMYTEVPPKTIRPRDNVIVRLCDTGSNFTKPITDADNAVFREKLEGWSGVAKHLRVWDYAVTYAPYTGFPMPTIRTFQPDFAFYAAHNVEGVFTELEYPILADTRDLKVWMMAKLLEDPSQDPAALIETFTDGFYGPAGPAMGRYLSLLERAAERCPSYLSMGGGPRAARYLDLRFMGRASALFDDAEALLTRQSGDPELLRRLRHARLPLDRSIAVLYPALMAEWVRGGGSPETMPLARDATIDRYVATWKEQAAMRLAPAEVAAEIEAADREAAALESRVASAPLPERFRDVPASDVFDLLPDVSRNWMDIARVVADDGAGTGCAVRLRFPTEVETDAHPVERYGLPVAWGVYDQLAKANRLDGRITPEDVAGPGYHWYKLGATRVTPGCYLYLFWSWIIQFDLDAAAEAGADQRECEVWAELKFEGPSFPGGATDARDAISVARVLLVRR